LLIGGWDGWMDGWMDRRVVAGEYLKKKKESGIRVIKKAQ